MKLTCPKSVLAPALALAARVVERRNTVPILSNLRLTATEGRGHPGRLEIFATDLDLAVTIGLDALVAAAGATTAPAHLLAEMLRKQPDGQVTLEAEPERARLRVAAGRARCDLATLPAEDFPDFPDGTPKAVFRLDGAALAALLAPVTPAISTEETRYYLNGVYLHVAETPAGAQLAAVATDGHRLARVLAPLPEGAAPLPSAIVPRKTVEEWSRIAKAADGAIEIAAGDTKIALAASIDGVGLRLISKLIDGTFPDYGRVIPNAPPHRAEVPRELLAAIVDRVATVATGKGSRAVRFDWSADGLRLSVADADHGTAEETVDLDGWDGDPLSIGFNAAYLTTALAAFATERIAFRLTDPGSPTLIEPVAPALDAPGQTYVLMPMRV